MSKKNERPPDPVGPACRCGVLLPALAAERCDDVVHHVGTLPGEATVCLGRGVQVAEVAEGRTLPVAGTLQLEVLDERRRLEREDLANDVCEALIGHTTDVGAEGVHHHAHRFGHADRVRQLHRHTRADAGRNQVLGDVASKVCRGTVHLARVFARERATAVTSVTTVGVHDDLAPGQPGVAVGSTDHEPSGRVDEHLGVSVEEPGRMQRRRDHVGDDRRGDGGVVVEGGQVVDRDDHLGDVRRLAIHVPDRDLRLAVRHRPRERPVAAALRQCDLELLREQVARGHQLRRLVAGVPGHHALVTSALLREQAFAGGDALRDVRRLAAESVAQFHAAPVEAGMRRLVPAPVERVDRSLDEVDVAVAGHLASQEQLCPHDLVDLLALAVDELPDLTDLPDRESCDGRLAGDTRVRILFEAGIQHGVADDVAHLVRVTLGHRFGSHIKVPGHGPSPSLTAKNR